LILGGSVGEESNDREVKAGAGMFALRPPGFRHQVRFGARGALIISAAVDSETLLQCEAVAAQGRWAQAPKELLRAMLMGARSTTEVDDILFDLMACAPRSSMRAPPAWLRNARDSMVEEGRSIASLAEEAGVHRVYFSRAFTRAFGSPPSIYRQRLAALRAVAAAIGGGPAVRAAYACGFADQSHMSRVLKRMTGRSFGALKNFRAEVTSVQD
jgi:AraC family transcriptional regulator